MSPAAAPRGNGNQEPLDDDKTAAELPHPVATPRGDGNQEPLDDGQTAAEPQRPAAAPHGNDNQELPAGAAKRQAVRSMFDAIAGRYELVNRVMTLGLDRGWRRRAVRDLDLPAGSVVLDCACGTGDLCRRLEADGHSPVGLDFSAGMLSAARGPAPLVRADIANLPVPDGAADGAVCGFALRNLVEIGPFLAELARAVRPGGRIALLEVGQPSESWWGRGHRLYFERVVPRIGALLSDADAYRYLPRSLAYLPPAAELSADIAAAGFDEVTHRPLSRGLAQLFTATRRQP